LRARFRAEHHVVQTRPRRFERLERFVMHDCVQLIGEQPVDLGHALVDHRDDALVRARTHALVENLRCELADQLLRIAVLRRLDRHVPFLNDLLEQAQFAACRIESRGFARGRAGRLIACHSDHLRKFVAPRSEAD
jgi:hypothetical protein